MRDAEVRGEAVVERLRDQARNIEGQIDANGTAMRTGDAAYVTAAGTLDLAADMTSEVLVVDTPLP